jgi:phosphoribosylaminoimidazole-succinocarboxamide synthase
MDNSVMINSDFSELGEPRRGKVRDIYDLDMHLLMVVTDRISAFDVIMPDGIPGKGRGLTEISNIWFDLTKGIIPNHVVSDNVDYFAEYCPQFAKGFSIYADQLRGRSTLVKKVIPLSVEAIVRGYISGSGWKSYQKDQTICGIKLPDGLVESDKLPEVLFTPSTKAEAGLHDENISFHEAIEEIGLNVANQVRMASLEIYTKCAELALREGIIIADTKFEFGLNEEGEVILIDEVLTPDSSRFWPTDQYNPGGPQPSFDKQFLRDWLETLGWDKTFPGPNLPKEVIRGTQERYLKALELISNLRN